ncbi:SigE family RNA polymerase sigma factor [Streptomyces sp. NPDC051569]|uniref:SigE family RNA polymerase sigma factor n=1 Tax=Streptomyces sp. NPDC051569 TaxID=3365661 RepID=UPI003790A258
MNAPHGTAAYGSIPTAVSTRLHDVARSSEKSAAVTGRVCVRATGRPHKPPYMTVLDAAPGPVSARTADPDRTPDAPDAPDVPDAEAAFTAYVQERRASLYATAYHLTGDRFEAEDLLQSALFSTYRAWDRISDKAAVGGYLRRTMTNLHISAWRKRKLNEYPTEELPETAGDTDAMRGTELRAVLWQALSRLPELQRTMLVLRYYEGRTDPEIADILDISVGTVKSSIWRSLRRLREDDVLSFGRDEEESFGELVA